MKAAGIWDSMKAVYPMVGASAAACAQNLKSSSFTGTFSSGWTFASTGVTPNGISAFMNTGLNVNTQLNLNSHSFGIYSRTNNTTGNLVYGCSDFTNFLSNNIGFGNLISGTVSVQITYTPNPSTSLIMSSRTTNTIFRGFKAGVFIGQNTNSILSLPNFNFYLGARNAAGTAEFFNNHQLALAFLSDGLTDLQASDFYTAVQTFQTTLSRQV